MSSSADYSYACGCVSDVPLRACPVHGKRLVLVSSALGPIGEALSRAMVADKHRITSKALRGVVEAWG